jgi:hypothetical protein
LSEGVGNRLDKVVAQVEHLKLRHQPVVNYTHQRFPEITHTIITRIGNAVTLLQLRVFLTY